MRSPAITKHDAMIAAAALIEREGHYNFLCHNIPGHCEDRGCVLGWIGYVANIRDIEDVSTWLGYKSSTSFYFNMMDTMYHNNEQWNKLPSWTQDPKLAARLLRQLAEERRENA